MVRRYIKDGEKEAGRRRRGRRDIRLTGEHVVKSSKPRPSLARRSAALISAFLGQLFRVGGGIFGVN
jgi:hypothetical protein